MCRTFTCIVCACLVVGLTQAFQPLKLNLTAKVGARMSLPCRVPAGTKELVIQWFVGDTQLTMGMHVLKYQSRLLLSKPAPNELTLTIRSVVRSDENIFTCKSHNQVFSEIGVEVQWKPEIIQRESSKTQEVMVEGSTGQLKCTASGQPKPNVTWHRRPQDDPTFKPIGVTGDVLTIHDITRYGSDVYMCNASNTQGYATWEMNVTVHFDVQVKIYEPDMVVKRGEGVVMTCIIQGSPLYTYFWKFNEQKIGDNWKYLVHTDHDEGYPVYFLTLMIRDTTLGEYDFGNYTCHAEGSRSEAEDTIQISEKTADTSAGGTVYNVLN